RSLSIEQPAPGDTGNKGCARLFLFLATEHDQGSSRAKDDFRHGQCHSAPDPSSRSQRFRGSQAHEHLPQPHPALGRSMREVLPQEEIEAIDARASLLMQEGIRLMQSGNHEESLSFFDSARQLRLELPTDVPRHAYGLAACWLNRAEALTHLGSAHYEL